jgi:Family of unknown function (DUF6042)
MPKKKKSRRPARAARRVGAARNKLRSPASPRDVGPGEDGGALAPLRVSGVDTWWRRFLPRSALTVLDRDRPVAEVFGEIPADEAMWTWDGDEEDERTEDLVRDEFPHLTQDEVALVAVEWDAHDAEVRSAHRRRFTTLCDALGMAEPTSTFADLYRFCLQVGIAEERDCDGVPWVFPAPTARNVLDILSPDSDLAAAERAAQERDAAERLWETEGMLYGEYAEQIMGLFGEHMAREAVTTSIQRLARFLGIPEAAARHALAYMTSAIPGFGRSHMLCSHDPLSVPAHRVITLSVDWEAHDIDKGIAWSPAQQAGVACISCGADYRDARGRIPVVAGPAGTDPQQIPLVACQGMCAASYGSPAGTGQPVPPLEDRVLVLERLSAGGR